MDEQRWRALNNAAASSAVEGLPLKQADFQIIRDILDGKTTLQAYLQNLQAVYREK